MTDREKFEAWAQEWFRTHQRGQPSPRETWSAAALAERERCAKLCDVLCDDQWAIYKGLPPHKDHPARGNPYTEGVSDGAGLCADKIRQEPAP